MHNQFYTKSFYEEMRNGSRRSAEVIVPIVLQLLTVRSVVDVGCGDGNWLAIFQKYGVDEILGIDGDYVDRGILQIPQDRFQACDLAKPFNIGRVFDLAVSLEVVEHLPPEGAWGFVESLTHLAPAVLFSTAIPFQGGNHHINEQWPDKWAGLFREHDYVPVDFIRKRIWQSDAVEFWYAQNTLLFARLDLVESSSSLKAEFERTNPNQLCLVHPRQYTHLQGQLAEALARPLIPPPSGIKEASRLLLACIKNSVKKRLGLP
jgi:SAM-dependent methyltransferase